MTNGIVPHVRVVNIASHSAYMLRLDK
jgi:hypothetical protein